MTETLINEILSVIPELNKFHAPTSNSYKFINTVLKNEVVKLFSKTDFSLVDFAPIGQIGFPFTRMGNITTLDILNLDEFIMFAFYWINRKNYIKVADLGANLGLHSIILDKCGYKVRSYEPDSVHYKILNGNLAANGCKNVETYNQAVSKEDGTVEFLRVLGNTTSSHIVGSKPNPYGELEKISVASTSFAGIMQWADLIKCDIEGHEKEVFITTRTDDWLNTDALVEIESKESAQIMFEHFKNIGVNLFAQKVNWDKVEHVENMPCSYREGTLFISLKSSMPW